MDNALGIFATAAERRMIMTDGEIIDVLDCCVKYEPCDKCPMYKECEFFFDREYVGVPDILALARDLIKRQKAKIDQLEHLKTYNKL